MELAVGGRDVRHVAPHRVRVHGGVVPSRVAALAVTSGAGCGGREHEGGLQCTWLRREGLLKDCNFAARIEGRLGLFSTLRYLPMLDGRTTLANFFSPLVNNMEKMFLTGKAPYPVERTLLTTGLTA